MNYAEMTIEQLKAEINAAYGLYMYEEAAERGYDYNASRKAWNAYYQAKTELETRTAQESKRSFTMMTMNRLLKNLSSNASYFEEQGETQKAQACVELINFIRKKGYDTTVTGKFELFAEEQLSETQEV